MAKIAEQTERDIDYVERFHTAKFKIKNQIDALSHAACSLAIDIDAKLIVVCSRSGRTARLVSRFRSPKPIIGMTTDEKVWRKLALSWAVIPAMSEEFQSADVLFYHAVNVAKASGLVESGDVIVITGGQVNGKSGNTSLVKFETIK
ncbi:MAG: pyruvate kinase alpha/beta domain-containing protein, partial [Eubacteriales bacterium]|nr:pyruvate kinase alpha/beta domain-containing protein [Eubacteriales bacterium]